MSVILRRAIVFWFAAALIVFATCQVPSGLDYLEEIRPPDDQLTWVAKLYVGGWQCDPAGIYTPPDTKCLLNQAGIPVFETKVVYHPVCAACTCPSYAATHYALIKKEHLTRAERVGFEQEDPPGSE
jgi:hypothetical protein